MGRVRAISDEFTFNRYSDFELMSIVWAKHKAFVLVRPTCHFLIKLFCVGVVSGAIPNCRAVRLACKRHLDDLEKVADPDFPYKFSTKKAHKVCAFAEMLPLGGRWAGKGRTLVLQPWQCFALANIFGWLRKKDKLRRFRTAYILAPRKNGKSFLSAVIGLYMLLLDGESNAEIYSGATTEVQAQYVLRPAQQIVAPHYIDIPGGQKAPATHRSLGEGRFVYHLLDLQISRVRRSLQEMVQM
jgi:hypothetical protein